MRHSSTALILSGSWALLVLFALAGVASAQTPVPYTTFTLRGTQNGDDGVTSTYRGYRNTGDQFRIVCSEPCTEDLDAIYGLYAGFKPVYQQIVTLFGVTPTAGNQPFDIHVSGDHWCGAPVDGLGGDSLTYSAYSYSGATTGTYGCFWFTTPGHYALPFHYPETSTQAYQLITAHEFTHTEFFSRHYYSYEDFAKAISFYFSNPSGGPPITDACDDALNAISAGKLIWGLCHQNGFQYNSLAAPFTSIANLSVMLGDWTLPYQFQHALSKSLGSSTIDAFMASKQTNVGLIGDNGTLPYGGGRAEGIAGWYSFLVSVNALTSDFKFHLEEPITSNTLPPGLFEGANAFTLSGGVDSMLHFEDTVYAQVKYDPSVMTFGTDETSLHVYQESGNAWNLISESRSDPNRHLISFPITSPGTFAIAASPTLVSPTQIIARAVTNSNVHTRVVLRNPYGFATITGQLVFHRQGVPASGSDPALSYSIDPGAIKVFNDIVAAFGATGAGSIDVIAQAAGQPDVLAADIESGSSSYPAGTAVPAINAAAALVGDDRAMLVAPGNLQKMQFDAVVRTFGSGVTFTVIARDASGATLATTPLHYDANTMVQVSADTLAGGVPVQPSETFDIFIHDGSAIIEAETSAKGMASHNFTPAARIDLNASATGDALHLPKAISQTNSDGTETRTGLQLTNPSASTITGHVRFVPADGTSPAAFTYSIAAGATKTFTDVVSKLGHTGLGALDVISTSGNLPITMARVIYDGPQTPWQVTDEATSDVMDVLRAGDRAVLESPMSFTPDFNLGVRTFSKPLSVTITVTDFLGLFIAKVTHTFAANTSTEVLASTIFGTTAPLGSNVEIQVDGGSGLIYGSAVSPSTGATNIEIARRLPYFN
jgi:hypothetical protein